MIVSPLLSSLKYSIQSFSTIASFLLKELLQKVNVSFIDYYHQCYILLTTNREKPMEATMKAKYYIYKNLHTGTFSVKYRGKVIAHPTTVNAQGVEYRVSQNGRNRVLREKKKYVHAYVVCDAWQDRSDLYISGVAVEFLEMNFTEIKYNPYVSDCFMIEDCEARTSSHAVLHNGRVYARKSETVMYQKS